MNDQKSMDDPEEQRAIARIEQALSSLGSEYSPPTGWEARVLAASEAPAPGLGQRFRSWRPWQRWLAIGSPALVLAAAALALWLFRAAPPSGRLQLALAAPDGVPVQMMGEDAPGDRIFPVNRELRLSFESEQPHRALRIYRGDQLVFSCATTQPASAGCQLSADLLAATWTPTAIDRYTAVMFP